jgi:methionine synthase II (cobalamin-independent)
MGYISERLSGLEVTVQDPEQLVALVGSFSQDMRDFAELGRPAHHRRSAQRDRGSRAPGERAGLRDRGANPRHEYEWRVWEDVRLPEGKILIPGVVTHSTNVVEHPETVAQRIERYAGVLGRENVMAGTDCGFAQGWNMPRTHPTVQWAKLRALSEGARLASERLWS